MEHTYNSLCDRLFSQLRQDEMLTVSIGGESSQFIRFNQSKVRQIGLVNDATVSFDLITNQRKTTASIPFVGSLEKDWASSLEELERLREEIKSLPEDPFLIPPKNLASSHEQHTGNLLNSNDSVEALLSAMQGVDLSGIWASGLILKGSSNSVGQKHWFSSDTFSLDYSLITPDEKMVKGIYAGTEWSQTEYETQMQQSMEKLRAMNQTSKTLKPGHYRTCFAPAAVADFLGMFSWNGISESSLQQGSSAFMLMRNEGKRLSPLFSLAEDYRSGTVPRFNALGEVPPEFLPLIEKGKLENTLTNSRTAKEYGRASNYANEGESLRAPYMASGDIIESELLAELGEGLYISNLHYLNWSDPNHGRITGMTRYACFWVENGKLVAPIDTMRFDDSFYHFFGDQLEGVSDTSHFIPDVGTYEGRSTGGTFCPSIIVNEFKLTL